MNIKSIAAFKDLTDSSLKSIEKDAELLKYPMGYRISKYDIIPNKILLIVKGEARLLHEEHKISTTILKIKPGNFIGLASILRAKGCEFISASNEVTVLSISDSLILKLYKEEVSFRNWCNTKIQVAEIYELAANIQKNSSRSDLTIKNTVKVLLDNIKLKTINNGSRINSTQGNVLIVGSGNIIEKEIGSLIEKEEIVRTRGPFAARLLEIPESIYNNLVKLPNPSSQSNRSGFSLDINNLDIQQGPDMLDKSTEDLGQYNYNKKPKVIKAKGVVRESLACLQMLADQLNLPYRADSIEKIIRDSIEKMLSQICKF